MAFLFRTSRESGSERTEIEVTECEGDLPGESPGQKKNSPVREVVTIDT